MLNPGINIRRSKTTILFIWIFLFFSCVETLTESENDIIEISKTTIELDRYNNELFIQIETNQHETQEVIQEVLLELTYIGGNTYEYSEIFQLFDDGTNGDLIPGNGIYNLFTTADIVDLPEIEPKIIDTEIPDRFMLHPSNPDSMNISFTVLGKKFKIESKVIDVNDKLTSNTSTVNLDNSQILIEVNNDYMYIDENKLEDGDCTRIENPNPSINNFTPYFILIDSKPIGQYSNHFIFNFKFPFFSSSECGGTGRAILRFVLEDLDTSLSSDPIDFDVIIYACGDGYCTEEFENIDICIEDCQ